MSAVSKESHMDYQAFLTNELSQAADSPDYQGELQLFIVHYHQAMLEAIQQIQLCSCCSTLDLRRLKMNARDLQHSEFASVPALMKTAKSRLRDTALLCPTCLAAYQQDMLTRFFAIRTQQYKETRKKEKEE
jgi:hypothetical protein